MREVCAEAIAVIKEFEGEFLTAYLDPIGLPTVGCGHLIVAGEPYKVGQTITQEESDKLLRADLRTACECVEHAVTKPLTDNQFGALVSLTFNIGRANFKKSSLLKFLNEGSYAKAAQQFERWNMAGGKVLKGLVRRRKAEQALFNKQ